MEFHELKAMTMFSTQKICTVQLTAIESSTSSPVVQVGMSSAWSNSRRRAQLSVLKY